MYILQGFSGTFFTIVFALPIIQHMDDGGRRVRKAA